MQTAGCAALGLDGHGLALNLGSQSLGGCHVLSLVEIDVYKRQVPAWYFLSVQCTQKAEKARCPLRRDDLILQHELVVHKACLLYTSRCV